MSEHNITPRNEKETNREVYPVESEQSTVIDIENPVKDLQENIDDSVEKMKSRKDSAVDYNEYYQVRSPRRPIFFVYFNIAQLPPTGEPIEYDPNSRNRFVQLVFFLTFVMLAVTFCLNVVIHVVPFISEIFKDRIIGMILLITSAIVMIAMGYVMMLSECSRRFPCNYVCLTIVVIATTITVGVITQRYKILSIMLAFGTTTVVVGLCLLIACSRLDFTKFYMFIIVGCLAVSIVGMIIIICMKVFNIYFKPLHIVILIIFALASCITLIMELQMILGGKTIELGEEDYAVGAFMLYTSIIQLFLTILRLIGLIES